MKISKAETLLIEWYEYFKRQLTNKVWSLEIKKECFEKGLGVAHVLDELYNTKKYTDDIIDTFYK